MAKSLRSKTKRAYRSKKRESGVYAAVDAARLQRLSSKLKSIAQAGKSEDIMGLYNQEEEGAMVDTSPAGAAQNEEATATSNPEAMGLEDATTAQQQLAKKVSTHGRRMSRREEWRLSKGMSARPKSKGKNRQSGGTGKRKSGKPHRRR